MYQREQISHYRTVLEAVLAKVGPVEVSELDLDAFKERWQLVEEVDQSRYTRRYRIVPKPKA
jgi:hypothetical protein